MDGGYDEHVGDDHDELSVRPGTQAGWTIALFGEARCELLGHELGDLCELSNGLLTGYCVRCPARVEIPWFKGGTSVALGRAMVAEAATFDHPHPSVVEDLDQIADLLGADILALREVLSEVRRVQHTVRAKLAANQ